LDDVFIQGSRRARNSRRRAKQTGLPDRFKKRRGEWGNSLTSTYQHLRRETISFSTESEQEKTESTEFTKWLIVRPVCRSLTGFNSVNFVHSVFMDLEGSITSLCRFAMLEPRPIGTSTFLGSSGATKECGTAFGFLSERHHFDRVISGSIKRRNGNVRAQRRSNTSFSFSRDSKEFSSRSRELKQRGIYFEFQDHEISNSIYFSDPDGHKLEITTYDLDEIASSTR